MLRAADLVPGSGLDDELRDGELEPTTLAGIWLAIHLCPRAGRRRWMIVAAGATDT